MVVGQMGVAGEEVEHCAQPLAGQAVFGGGDRDIRAGADVAAQAAAQTSYWMSMSSRLIRPPNAVTGSPSRVVTMRGCS